MSFLAPGEIDRVWVLSRGDWGDTDLIGVYTTEKAAETAKVDCQRRDPSDAKRRRSMFVIDEFDLDKDLSPHYWWEPKIEAQ